VEQWLAERLELADDDAASLDDLAEAVRRSTS